MYFQPGFKMLYTPNSPYSPVSSLSLDINNCAIFVKFDVLKA
jgi:hypothetical protein